jgi:hypothetical protein
LFREGLGVARYALKDPNFAHEREWRMAIPVTPWRRRDVRFREREDGLTPYWVQGLPTIGSVSDGPDLLRISAIRLGPKLDARSIEAIKMFVYTLGYDPELVHESKVPLR